MTIWCTWSALCWRGSPSSSICFAWGQGAFLLFFKHVIPAVCVLCADMRFSYASVTGVFVLLPNVGQKLLSVNLLMLSYREVVGGCPKGFVGVNMFGAIMLDHLIMTRPSGSWACLLFFLLSTLATYADNTILPQCNSSLKISIRDGLNSHKGGLNGVLHLQTQGPGDAWWTFPFVYHRLSEFRSIQPTFLEHNRHVNAVSFSFIGLHIF